jgi:enolase
VRVCVSSFCTQASLFHNYTCTYPDNGHNTQAHKDTPPPNTHTHTQAIANAGYTGKIKIGMDVAASEFYQVITLNHNQLLT